MTTDYSAPTPTIAPPSPRHVDAQYTASSSPFPSPSHIGPSSSSSSAGRMAQSIPRSPRVPSHPIVLHRLPPSSAITKESVFASELELDKQTKQVQRERELKEALQDQVWSFDRAAVRDAQGTWSALQAQNRSGSSDAKGKDRSDSWGSTKGFVRPPQAFELYRAIDKHDIEFIMRVRDHAFHLLLQKNGADFPIVYASRLGDGHRDIVILLVGALSRYVNHLEPEDFEKRETKNTLKSLRANTKPQLTLASVQPLLFNLHRQLKLAIDHTIVHLPPGQTPMLLSSYLQVLIMSEGDSFLYKSIQSISLLLRDTTAVASSSTSSSSRRVEISSQELSARSRPVHEAEEIMRRFCTKELRGVKGGVGDVEDYIANATLDLVLMSAWSLAASQLNADLLPTHTFARDMRTWKELTDAIEHHTNTQTAEGGSKHGSSSGGGGGGGYTRLVNPRLRRTLHVLCELAGDSKKGVRGRLRDVQLALDGVDDRDGGDDGGGGGGEQRERERGG
ncbi:hypothetical protein IAU59_002814 [Kwoniella sp. CBS 9459]